MALSYDRYSRGIALIRKLNSASDTPSNWTHVAWINGQQDLVVDTPTTGFTYDYRTVLVMGCEYEAVVLTAGGRQTLVASNIKR